MKKTIALISSCVIASLLFSGCGKIPFKEDKILDKGTSLHYINKDYNVGDVHPFYNEKTKTWFMFYLKPGDYASRLLVSKDMIKWEEKDINFEYNVAPTKYYALGIIKDGDVFRSYYGRGSYHGSTQSSDLLLWKNSPAAYKVPNDSILFPAGARDPYVFFDPDENVFRCTSTSYRVKKDADNGNEMDCSIGLSSTKQNNLTSWTSDQVDLIRFPDGLKGQPECSQMFKMGDRWYLWTSLYGRSNNGVGRPTYWIGDAGKKILENDWQNKPENSLDGDDLCAAQVASDGKTNYMWGWIEKKWQGGDWGGHINLPHEVYQMSDGSLATRLAKTVGEKIRGKQLATLAPQSIKEGSEVVFEGDYTRADIEAKFKLNKSTASISIGEIKIQINAENSFIGVNKDENDPTQYFATYRLADGALNGDISVRIIAEEDMIEVFVNDKYALCARVSDFFKSNKIKIIATKGDLNIQDSFVYHLKFIEEL
jgi:sucrose-6-phosphate hydrolase SacC (GH32 family)